jgi:hypothetical protein
MAVQLVTTAQAFQGLAADTKPTSAPVGSSFHETDSGRRFVWNLSSWLDVGAQFRAHITDLTEIPGIGTGASYASGDAIGTTITFSGIPHFGIIQSAMLLDKDDDNVAIDLIVHNATFTQTADNAPYDVSDSDNESIVDVVEFGVFVDLVTSRVAFGRGRGHLYSAPAGALYCQAITRGGSNIASSQEPMVQLSILAV